MPSEDMRGIALSKVGLAYASVFVPLYSVERLTNFYFLEGGGSLFGTMSGLRIELFIIIVMAAPAFAGALLGRLYPAVLASSAAIITFLSLVYVFCDPRVCYSAGLDGLEPLRLGADLASVAVAASSIGVFARTRAPLEGRERVLATFATYFAIAYYPVVFTFAGTRLLAPLDPFATGMLLFLLSFTTAAGSTERFGRVRGMMLTLGAGVAVVLVCGPIAAAYLQTVAFPVAVILVALLLGASSGAVCEARGLRWVDSAFAKSSWPLLVAVLLVLVMTFVVSPDASVGLIPANPPEAQTAYGFGVPVFAGAYMDAPLGSAQGVAVDLSFAGTNFSSIQPDNFLSAGIYAHSPGCCVDGIDYGYTFDVYAFHGGNASLVAGAWQVCDDNAACGGHSWKVLMFQRVGSLNKSLAAGTMRLSMTWNDRTPTWSYSFGGGEMRNFTSFVPPSGEKGYFNTGYLGGGPTSRGESGYYFLQVGVSSKYPISRAGWSVLFVCPETLGAGTWTCIQHSRTLQGGQSYWKVLWRWGEDYPNAVADPLQSPVGVRFSYSANSTMRSFEPLW